MWAPGRLPSRRGARVELSWRRGLGFEVHTHDCEGHDHGAGGAAAGQSIKDAPTRSPFAQGWAYLQLQLP